MHVGRCVRGHDSVYVVCGVLCGCVCVRICPACLRHVYLSTCDVCAQRMGMCAWCVCVCVCVCVFVSVFVCVPMCVYVCVSVCLVRAMRVCLCTCTFVSQGMWHAWLLCVCVRVCVCMYTHFTLHTNLYRHVLSDAICAQAALSSQSQDTCRLSSQSQHTCRHGEDKGKAT